jgi:Sec-independent protein translocase protein TatA
LDEAIQKETPWGKYAIYFVIFLVIVGVIVYVVIQQNNLKRIRRESEEKVGSLKSDFENKLKDTSEQIKSVSRTAAVARSQQSETSSIPEPVEEIPKTQEEIIAAKYDELLSDYKDALDDFSKVAVFKQKWNGLALSRKERQDGSKTILISASRAFEKSGIWCVSFDDKYFAFPGSTVKSNMATYMNMDFMKAGQDFKGVFGVTTSSAYSSEPAVLRKSGAGYVVERAGKIAFPD